LPFGSKKFLLEMKCEKCGKEKEEGRTYTFYYGNRIDEEIYGDYPINYTRVSKYALRPHSSWICKECVHRVFVRSAFSITLGIFIFFFIFFYKEAVSDVLFGVILIILTIAWIGLIGWGVFSIWNGGEGIAMKLNRSWISKEYGCNSFFAAKEYEIIETTGEGGVFGAIEYGIRWIIDRIKREG